MVALSAALLLPVTEGALVALPAALLLPVAHSDAVAVVVYSDKTEVFFVRQVRQVSHHFHKVIDCRAPREDRGVAESGGESCDDIHTVARSCAKRHRKPI